MDAKNSPHHPGMRAPGTRQLPLLSKPGASTPCTVLDDRQGNPPEQWSLSSSAPGANTNESDSKNAISKLRKPRKANHGGVSKSTLFWVHADPQSVAEGDRTRQETLKRIRSHVMSEHNRKKRLENSQRYKNNTWKHLAFQPVETTSPESFSTAPSTKSVSPGNRSASTRRSVAAGPGIKAASTRQSKPVKAVANFESYSPSQSSDSDASRSKPYSPDRLTVAARPSPYGYVAQGAIDPFNMSHTPLSDRTMRHLQHFLVDLTKAAVPLENRSGPKLQQHWLALVRRAPVVLQACICMGASEFAVAAREFPLVDESKRSSPLILDTFYHRGETIRLVNIGLSDPMKAASDELIAAVSILLVIEIASGNADYLKVHLAGLRQMVGLRNSFADVPADLRWQISWTDVRVACMAFSKPIFPFVRCPRPAKLPISAPNEDLAPSASRLLALAQIPGIFGNVMSETVFDLVQLFWYSEWIREFGYQVFDEGTEEYFNCEVLHTEYVLHDDRYTEHGEIKGDANIEGCVRLACLLYHNTVFWSLYPLNEPVFPKPVKGLRMALEATIPAGYFKHCKDVLIWILFIGACSCISRERDFFVTELATAVGEYGLQSWQELRLLLMDFFYMDRTHLAPLRTLWNEIWMVPIPRTS